MSVITEYIKMHVACALLVVGILVGMLIPSKACASEPPAAGPIYHVEISTGGCGTDPVFVFQSPTRVSRQAAPYAREWFLTNDYSRTAVQVQSYSANLLPTDGSCVTATAAFLPSGSFTVYFRIIAVDGGSYDLSVMDAQSIILAALLLWGLAWGFRQFQRVGTQHHD